MKGRPFLNRVVIKRATMKDTIKTKLIIPEAADKRHAQDEGILLQVGDTVPEQIKNHIGKKVIFAKYAGAWIKIGDEECFICNDEDILYLMEE
jgi:co-chaperonin GroES (HSP10)